MCEDMVSTGGNDVFPVLTLQNVNVSIRQIRKLLKEENQ